jgi:hypothetical protein
MEETLPIIAVGVAVASIGALATGAVAVTAFSVVAAVGATVAAVGAVTHNKVLTYVGAGLGLVGGIGAVASSAGLFSAADEAAITAAPSAADAAAGATSGDVIQSLAGSSNLTDQAAAASEAAMGPAGSSASDAAAATSMSAEQAASGLGMGFNAGGASATNAPQVGVGINNTDTAGAASTGAADQPLAAPVSTGSSSPILSTPSPDLVDQAATGLSKGAVVAANTTTTTDQAGGTFGNILSFVEKHPTLALGALQGGGQFLSGLTSTITPAQVTALNAQAANNQAAANLTAQQAANLSQPKPIATLAPVTGAPNPILTPPTAGIINAAPRVNVTGVPA